MTAVATQQEQAPEREITTSQLPAVIRSSAKARNVIAPFLPEGVSLERVAASLTIAIEKDRAAWKKEGPPPLERCSPMSVFMAVAKAAQLGLEVGETAHLVPFGTECTMVPDYKGLAQLVIASGVVRHVEAHCVYEKEPFKLKLGTTTEIEHMPMWDAKARGNMIGGYALFRLRGGYTHVKYMSVEEVDAIRQRYSKQWKNGPLEPWYVEKSCVRQGVKLLPKDPRLAKTLAVFDEIDAAELGLAVPAPLRALESGDKDSPRVHTIEHREPRPVATSGHEPYAEAPIPPAQHSDNPSAQAEDFEDSGELALGEERRAPAKRRNALKEG